jgi:DNA-binding transcriptional ArsR family regulator
VKRRKRSLINKDLIQAAQQGDIGSIRAALTEGATNIRLALKEAMESGQVAALAYLLDARPVEAHRYVDELFSRARWRRGRPSCPQVREILCLLLSRLEPLDPAEWFGWLSIEIAGGIDLEVFRAYLDAGLDARELDDRPLRTAWDSKREDIAGLLIERGADPQTARPNWELCQAIERGDLESVIHWLNAGAAASFDNEWPLFLALERSGSIEIVRLLVERGARPTERFADFLSAAADSGRLEIVRFLVEEQDVCPRAHGAEALAEAARKGALDIMRFLLDRGAPIQAMYDEATENWHDALESAAYDPQLEAMTLLLDRGADPNFNHSESLLQVFRSQHWDAVRLLLDRGANPSALDSLEEDVLLPDDLARRLGRLSARGPATS